MPFWKYLLLNLEISNLQSNKHAALWYLPRQMCYCGFFSADTWTLLFALFLPTVFYIEVHLIHGTPVV